MIRLKKILVFFVAIGILSVSVCALAGPSYTKLDAQGNALPDSATSWSMVKDNGTGLIWERKTNDGSIHYKDEQYTWDDVQSVFIATLNAQKFGGSSDWRLPTVEELMSIVNTEPYDPTTNTDYFSNFIPSKFYWPSDIFAICTAYRAADAAYDAAHAAAAAACDAACDAARAAADAAYIATCVAARDAYIAAAAAAGDAAHDAADAAADAAYDAAIAGGADIAAAREAARDAADDAYNAATAAATDTIAAARDAYLTAPYYASATRDATIAAAVAAANTTYRAAYDAATDAYIAATVAADDRYIVPRATSDAAFNTAYVGFAIAVRSGQSDPEEPPTPAGITVTHTTELETTEDGDNAEFTVVLNTQPTADVIIYTISDNFTEGGRLPLSLTFTSSNWNIPQTVTVYGFDDDIVDGDVAYTIITDPATSDDPAYSGLDADDVSVINRDNEPSYPIVISYSPQNGATNVVTDTRIIGTFSKSMDKSSVQNAFNINPEIDGDFTWSNSDRTVSFIPNSRFLQDQLYTVNIGNTASDTDGTNFNNPFTFSFTTREDLHIKVVTGSEIVTDHFFYEQRFEAVDGFVEETPMVPIRVWVTDYNLAYVEGATVLIDGVSYGETDENGFLYIPYPIPMPSINEDYTGSSLSATIEVTTTSGLSGKSDPVILYECSPRGIKPNRCTFTAGNIMCTYIRMLFEMFSGSGLQGTSYDLPDITSGPTPGNTAYQIPITSLIKAFIVAVRMAPYQEGDVLIIDQFEFTSPNVAPAWLIRRLLVRNGEVLVDFLSFTENEGFCNASYDYMNKLFFGRDINLLKNMACSPVVLYVTAPNGSRAGYDPSTGKLVMDLPIVISRPGEEPFYLMIPNPAKGEYITTVVGTGTGDYTLFIQTENADGPTGEEFVLTGSITEKEIHKYDMVMSEPEIGEDATIEYVEPFTSGDIDGNTIIDQTDFTVLISYRGQPASACLKCDLDEDGRITVLDARKQILLYMFP